MKVVILAAGRGKRLHEVDQPKCLTSLSNGQKILERQLSLLSPHVSPSQITLVVGYLKEQIQSAFPHIPTVENPHYDRENTAKSLLRALETIDDDILWLNGDVVFHPSTLSSLLPLTCSTAVVNRGEVDDEAVKYTATKEGQLLSISKTTQKPLGESLGINFFTKKDLPILKKALQKCSDTDYFEKAIEDTLSQGLIVQTYPIPVDHCAEVDFPQDLDHVNFLLSTWSEF